MTLADSARQFIRFPAAVALSDGRMVTLRGGTSEDAGELAAMHVRCSPETLEQRYGSATQRPIGRLLAGLLSTEAAVVAISASSGVIALANLSADTTGAADLAVIVEDDWQHRGLGSAMVRHLLAGARLLGYREATMATSDKHGWAAYVLTAAGPTESEQLPSGGARVRLALAPHHVGGLGKPVVAHQRVAVDLGEINR